MVPPDDRCQPYDNAEYVNQLKVVYAGTTGNDPENVPAWVTMISGAGLKGYQVNINRNHHRTLIKLIVFAVITVITTSILALTIGNVGGSGD